MNLRCHGEQQRENRFSGQPGRYLGRAKRHAGQHLYDRGRPAALRLSGPGAGRGPRLAPMLADTGQDFAAAPAQHCFGHGDAQGLRFGGGFDGLDFLYVLLAA